MPQITSDDFEKINVIFGRQLRRRRRLLGLTQNQLADLVGVRFQQIQKYECGSNRMNAVRMYQIAQALEVPVTYFFDKIEEELGKPESDVQSSIAA